MPDIQAPPLSKTIAKPTLASALDLLKKNIMLSLNCHAIATVQSFNSSAQTVSATINYSKTYYTQTNVGKLDAKTEAYPILVDMPVISLCGGVSYLSFPIEKGDQCLVLFNDRDMDNYVKGAFSGSPATSRMHSMSDGLALVGLNKISSYDSNHAKIQWGTNGPQVGVSSTKVMVKNTIGTLNALLQELITEIQTLVTQTAAITVTGVTPGVGTSGPPANAAAITAIAAQITVTSTKIGQLLE